MGYFRIAAIVACALSLAAIIGYGLRNDQLRGRYLDRLNSIRIELKDSGFNKIPNGQEAQTVKLLRQQRDDAAKARDQAQAVVDIQSSSISQMGEETAAAERQAAQQRKLYEATRKERDAWIARARSAETRTERLSAEEEVSECEKVMDDLRQSGF